MIGIVLDVHADESLCDSVDNGQLPRGTVGDPSVLQVRVEANVSHGAKPVPQSRKFFAATDNLEDFLLDFTLKGCIEFVTAPSMQVKDSNE